MHSVAMYSPFLPYYLTLLADRCGKVGQLPQGLTVLDEAFAAQKKTSERFWEAELYRLKGEMLIKTDSWKMESTVQKEVEECFQTALDIARHQGAKSLELRAATSLAHLWQRQGKKEEAHQLLSEVYNWFTEGFDTADLKDAKALLDQLSEGS